MTTHAFVLLWVAQDKVANYWPDISVKAAVDRTIVEQGAAGEDKVRRSLAAALPGERKHIWAQIADWEAAPGRTREDVVALFDRALKKFIR